MSQPSIQSLLKGNPIIPVVAIADADHAVPLAEALLQGGINIIEVTLRTPAALEAIRRINQCVPGMCVAAGTVLQPQDIDRVRSAGAAFAVSPGATTALLSKAKATDFPFMPGIATPSEAMSAVDAGFDIVKFFPAAAAGGVEMLKGMAGPLADIRFCPTGGINLDNLLEFQRLENVICVGGTWIASPQAITQQDWEGIATRARTALSLVTE